MTRFGPGHPAGGFTGSVRGGRALFDIASGRPAVPFYGELGSINPAVDHPAAEAPRRAVAEGLASSFTMGTGQFCTKPGLLFLPAGHGLADALLGRRSYRSRRRRC